MVVGKVRGVHGVRGWFKVVSYTRPLENLLGFQSWMIRGASGWTPCQVLATGRSGGDLTVLLDLARSRTDAQPWIGSDIGVRREQLPRLPAGQHYWLELIGLKVRTAAGREFGTVTGLLETGANDVLEVEGNATRILIPYVPGRVVQKVDVAAGVIQVDWDPEYQ